MHMAVNTVEGLRLQEGVEDFLPSAEMASRRAEIGHEIFEAHKDTERIVVIPCLEGAMQFATDLSPAIDHPGIVADTIRAQSYHGDESSGTVKILSEPDIDLTDEAVVIIEDIIDTRRTLHAIVKYVKQRGARSVDVAAALNKPDRAIPGLELDIDNLWVCFEIDNRFVVGYGMDLDGEYRDLSFVTAMKDNGNGLMVPIHKVEPSPAGG